MQLVLSHPGIEPFEPAKDVKVVAACEDSAAADLACGVLELIGRDCKSKGRLIYSWWQFEVLAVTVVRELATSEAAAADIIVIATHGGAQLPEQVLNWIGQWLERGQLEFRPRALIALIDADRPEAKVSRSIVSKLQTIAELGQMDFYATEVVRGVDAARTGDPGHRPAVRKVAQTCARSGLPGGEGLSPQKYRRLQTK